MLEIKEMCETYLDMHNKRCEAYGNDNMELGLEIDMELVSLGADISSALIEFLEV